MKIDFVITWVDNTDEEWLKEKQKYSPNKNVDARNVRYRDWDNLKYWFRSVEKFAPWVNKIYFVTSGHLPTFLDTSNPKLVIVNHKDFIPEEYLPTFNNRTIELNLHRIKDLAENFVYFNDDMFLIKPTNPEHFFKNNLPCDTAVLNAIVPNLDNWEHTLLNNTAIINKYFKMKECIKRNLFKWFNFKYGSDQIRTLLLLSWNNFPGMKFYHLPISYKKDAFIEVWAKEGNILHNTCNQKFRNNLDSVNNWVIQNWQLAKGDFIPRKANFGKFHVLDNSNKKVTEDIKNKKYYAICLNDSYRITEFEKVKVELEEAFKSILPEKSSFEK